MTTVKEVIKDMEERRNLANSMLKLNLERECKADWQGLRNELNYWLKKLEETQEK